MAKVICKLPNASGLISGVIFVTHKDGMISDQISDEEAARFCSIPGYELAVDPEKAARARTGKQKEPSKPADPTADGKDTSGDKTGGEALAASNESPPPIDPNAPKDPPVPAILPNVNPTF